MVVLTYPRSHSRDEMRPLFEEFRAKNPDVFAKWKALEANWKDGNELKIKSVHLAIHEFLMPRTQWDSVDGLGEGYSDFRRLMWELLRGEGRI